MLLLSNEGKCQEVILIQTIDISSRTKWV